MGKVRGTNKKPMHRTPLLSALFLLVGLTVGIPAQAQEEPRVYALTRIDRDFMEEQRAAVDDLARTYLGRQVRRQKDNDLEVLQQLLDRRAVKPDETVLLQAMGVVLGDLLSDELNMPWVIYEDRLGRSRALRAGTSDEYLFPVTMISRRAEVGAGVNVREIFDKSVELMKPHLPPRPFDY